MKQLSCQSALTCLPSCATLFVVNIIIIPCLVILLTKIYKIRSYPEFISRHANVIITQSIFVILDIFFRSNYIIISSFIVDINSDIKDVINLINMSLLLVMPLFLLYRICLMYIDFSIAVHEEQQNWIKKLIDANTVNHQQEPITNFEIISNYKFFMFYWLVLILIMVLCILFMPIITMDNSYYTFSIILVLFILLPIIVIYYYKIPPFNDPFAIKYELLILIRCNFVMFSIFTILIYWNSFEAIYLTQIWLIIILNCIQSFTPYYLCTAQLDKDWLINEQHHQNNNCCDSVKSCFDFNRDMDALQVIDHTSSNSMRGGRVRRKSVEQRILTNKKLFNVLIHNDIGINLFFSHLIREFCVENGLFFIESMQWISNILTDTNNNIEKFDISPFVMPQFVEKFKFASIVPISSINNNHQLSWFEKLHKIHKKYIDTSSQYQVNLSYQIQTAYLNLFNLYKIKQDIENGSYKPKMKRKTHKKNTGILASTNSIWSRFTLRSRTTQNIDKVNNEIKGTEQSQQTKTERENEIKEADSEMTTTDDIMPSYTHKKSITITDINVIKSREQKRDSGLYLEQKPHASDGDQSPTKSKSKRNNKNSDNNNSGSNHNKFLISPRSIAKTFTKSISPKSGTFTFGGLALPNTDLIRQGTFVEHQSIDDQSDPSEDEQDDDDDEDDLSHDEDGAFQINTSDFYTESNLIVIDEENEIKANDPNHHSIKKQQDHMHGKKTTESEMNSILKDVLLDVNEAIDEEKEREEKERKEKLKEKEKESHTVINSLITITSMDFDIEENKNDTSRKDNVNNLNLLSPTSQSTIISMEGGIPIPSSTKRSSAIMRGFTRLSGILQHSSTMDDRDENEIDEEEKNLMEKANKVCLNDFVSLTSKAIYSILQLQYQSITRFKKTKEFILFEQSVDLNELLQKYG